MDDRLLKRSREGSDKGSQLSNSQSGSPERLQQLRNAHRFQTKETGSSQIKQGMGDKLGKTPIDFLIPEERENYQSGTKKTGNEMTQKEVLALLLYEMAEYRIKYYDSETEGIKESFSEMRKMSRYKEI